MDIGASQKCVIFGCIVFLKIYSELINQAKILKLTFEMYFCLSFKNFWGKIDFTRFGCFFNQKCLHNRALWTKKY